MIVRAVVAVALAAALLAATLPSVDRARVDHADARVAGEVERLERAATALAARNDLVDDGQPARTHLTLRLPERTWGTAPVDAFRIPAAGGEADVRWTVDGGRTRQRRLDGVDLSGSTDGLALRTGGRHRLALELRAGGDGRRIEVRWRGSNESAAG